MFLVFYQPPFHQFGSRKRIHDYTQRISGRDYFFEAATAEAFGEQRFHLTASGAEVNRNDEILLQGDSDVRCYRVEHVDHYCDGSGMWIALLAPCKSIADQNPTH